MLDFHDVPGVGRMCGLEDVLELRMYSQIKWGSPSLLTWFEWVETMKMVCSSRKQKMESCAQKITYLICVHGY